MNPKSCVSLETPDNEDGSDERLFKRGDIVSVKLIENIREAMRSAKVPTAFLEYLRGTAELRLVDDDLDYLIKYNCNQQVQVLALTLRKATEDEKENHNKVKILVKNIRIGSSVFLDVGPPSYVKSVLQGFSVPGDVVRALMTPSILVGYERGGKAVIEYDNGLKYRVKKKYLTVPEKFNMQSTGSGPSLEIIKSLEENIKTTVARKDTHASESVVKIISMSFDGSPFIDFRVYSNQTSIEDISENMIDLNLEVKPGFDNWFYVSGLPFFEREIKISIFFNDEPYSHNFTEFEKSQTLNDHKKFAQTKKKQHSMTERGGYSTARKRKITQPVCDELQSHGVEIDRSQFEDVQVRDPSVITLRGYKYLRLSENVYLPLCLGVPNGELFSSGKGSGGENTPGPSTMINLNVSESKINKIKFTGGN